MPVSPVRLNHAVLFVADLPRAEWGEHEHTASIDRLDLAAEVRRWSGVGTAGRLVPGSAGAAA